MGAGNGDRRGTRGTGRQGAHGGSGRRSASKFLVCTFAALIVCCAAMLAVIFGCLSLLNRVSGQLQGVLAESLDHEINIASAETSFSGTLHNISDDLLNDPALVDLGLCAAIAPGPALDAAQDVLADVVARTQEAPGVRYLYFARADYLMGAALPGQNARGTASAPVEAILDELRVSTARITGNHENHVGNDGESNYQLMVRTVAPSVYYVVYFDRIEPPVPASFSGFKNVQSYYYDRFGGSVACSGPADLLGAYTYGDLGESDTGVVYTRQNGINYIGVYCTSHTRNIRLAIFFVDETAAMRDVSLAVAVLAAAAVVACLATALWCIRRFYRPVQSLARQLEKSAAGGMTGTAPNSLAPRLRDDGAVIGGALDAYRSTVERQQGLLSTAWLYRLLCGDDSDALGEYEDPWVTQLQGRLYTVAVVRSDAPEDGEASGAGGQTTAQAGERPGMQPGGRASLEDVVAEQLGGAFDCRFVLMSGQVVAVVSLAGTSETELLACLGQLRDTHPDLVLSAFTGTPRTAVGEISACFDEAMAAAGRCLGREAYGVVERYADSDETREGPDADVEAARLLPQLMRRIRALNVAGALETFDEVERLAKRAGERGGQSERGSRAEKDDRGDDRLALLAGCCALALEGLADDADIARLRSAQAYAPARKALAAALKRLAAAEEQVGGQTLYERLETFVRENYRDPNLSAGSLARQASVSQSQITKLFKRYRGTTFLEYLHSLRLDEAAALLATTDLSEREIARLVGYGNTITMIRAFKRYRGVVPSALRKVGEG